MTLQQIVLAALSLGMVGLGVRMVSQKQKRFFLGLVIAPLKANGHITRKLGARLIGMDALLEIHIVGYINIQQPVLVKVSHCRRRGPMLPHHSAAIGNVRKASIPVVFIDSVIAKAGDEKIGVTVIIEISADATHTLE